ncbi:MAG TPA: PAS domain S-box protein, partial [Candidatus Kryptobacter bacterium]|nr:PAS domain S-box protein [Candidatus Kryptobacter bacterium]
EEIVADLSFRLSHLENKPEAEKPKTEMGEKKEMSRKFVDSAGEVFWIMNIQPELILYVNPAFEHIWGRPVAELYRNPRLWMDSIHIDDRPRIMEAFSNWIQKVPGSVYDVEYRIVRPDGNIRWISDRGFALLQEDGPGSSVAGIAADITDRKIAEENLEASRERYKSILDNMMEGCMIIGFDWTYLYVNDAAARHGYQERKNLIGRTMMSAYPGVEKSAVFARYRQCMDERVPQRFESSYTFDDGTTNWYEFRVAPVPEGIFVLSLDITERVRADGAPDS